MRRRGAAAEAARAEAMKTQRRADHERSELMEKLRGTRGARRALERREAQYCRDAAAQKKRREKAEAALSKLNGQSGEAEAKAEGGAARRPVSGRDEAKKAAEEPRRGRCFRTAEENGPADGCGPPSAVELSNKEMRRGLARPSARAADLKGGTRNLPTRSPVYRGDGTLRGHCGARAPAVRQAQGEQYSIEGSTRDPRHRRVAAARAVAATEARQA